MPRTPQNGVEEWLALWAGEEITPREPQSRVEQQLARLAGVNIVPEPPQSPEEDWLEIIYQNGGGGGITPTGTISITENGTVDVTQYAEAAVAVPQPSGKITITENGTDIDVAAYAKADVNVYQGFDYRGLSGVKFAYMDDTAINLSTLDTSDFTDFSHMFQGSAYLTTIDCSGFDTSSARKMNAMFDGCRRTTTINLTGFDTSSVTTMNYMFNECRGITSLDLRGFTTGLVTGMSGMITGCLTLTDVIWAIESTTVQPLVTANGFDKTAGTVPSDLNIWVRDELLASYQQATNWDRYSACFKKISELPQALQTLYNIDPSDYYTPTE